MNDTSVPALGIVCALAVLSALAVVLARRPVYAVVALLAHSLSIAMLFGILLAGIVAVGQLIIYSGAIVVLFLLVVTLLPMGGIELPVHIPRAVGALVVGAALLAALAAAFVRGLPSPVAAGPGDVGAVGRALFGPLVAATELTAPLLLVAVVSAVTLWRRHEAPPSAATRSPAPTRRRLIMHP